MLRPLNQKHGQSTVEYAMIIIIVIGALLASQNYFKRGIQGRWREAVDGLGEQYDPRVANGVSREELHLNTMTQIMATDVPGGQVTERFDYTNSIQRRTGNLVVGGY